MIKTLFSGVLVLVCAALAISCHMSKKTNLEMGDSKGAKLMEVCKWVNIICAIVNFVIMIGQIIR